MIAASYQEALVTFRNLCDEGVDNVPYPEYVRGGVELIADLFAVYEMPLDERKEQVMDDLRRIPQFANPARLDVFGVLYSYNPVVK